MGQGERFVALGLAQARSTWFREVGRWSDSAALPLEYLKCVTVEEVRARLRTGRPFSALLVDGGVAGFDRDLVDDAKSCGCAVIVVDDGRSVRDWPALGATAVLSSDFDRNDLLAVLEATTVRIGIGDRSDDGMSDRDAAIEGVATWRGRLVAVTGPGGTGASTVAMALAQGLAADVRLGGLVVLADLALDADQAMLHDAGDVVPGIQELVESHRTTVPSASEVRSLAYSVAERNYDLVLGLRRHRDWVTIRPRAFDAALDGLRRAYKAVVADVSNDLEGERQCGSVDVEERNLMSRSTTSVADVVVVVGSPGLRGIHRLVRLVAGLVDHGVDATSILPVVNRASRNPRHRAEVTAALSALTRPFTGPAPLPSPIFIGERRKLDEVVHGAGRLPESLVAPVSSGVGMMLERIPETRRESRTETELVPVTPGSLGSWYDES